MNGKRLPNTGTCRRLRVQGREMPEHYTKNCIADTAWCNKCKRRTLHAVDNKRLGHCLEHKAQEFTKAQQKRIEEQARDKREPRLF